ncbi:MAG: phosphoadenosine phosphosulfate reductase family protein [Oscillospiraceae bacterium]|nr:phosphoadenosine phosphosulfate reductase family protein [Oscillospiraceae bacterium]
MSELAEKVALSIDRLKCYEGLQHNESYYLAFSGGKDSCVVKRLMDMAGVKYDAHYRVTSVDPPELVQFIKEQHPDVEREVPKYGPRRGPEWEGKPITMWNLIPWKLMPPTRIARYCCDYLKEGGGDGRLAVTGVRWAESVNRSKRQGIATVFGGDVNESVRNSPYFRVTGNRGAVLVNDNAESRQILDACVTRHKTCLNPIIDWTDRDIWDFINGEKIPVCDLYHEGFHRLGCIGCPMASIRERTAQFARWPTYKRAYMRAIQRMLEVRKERGMPWQYGETADDVYHWWMEDGVIPNQEMLEEFEEEMA